MRRAGGRGAAGLGRRAATAAALALALGLGGAERGSAQAALLGPGAAYLGGGVSAIDIAGLNDRLATSGYPTFGGRATALSIGAYRVLRSGVMLGFEGNGLILGEQDHRGGEVGLGGGYATLGVGYAVPLSRRARVYPRLGIGPGGLGMWIESGPDSVGFEEVLERPASAPERRVPVLSRDGAVLDAGFGAELTPAGRGGLLVGVRFGYLLAPFDSEWDFYERTATGGPDASLSGPYLRLIVGGAWRR